jgi:hypothetical protein
VRRRAGAELARLPEHLHHLADEPRYPVTIAPALRDLTQQVDLQSPS